ncbi:MAG TPA: hypothetical protein VEF33_06060 [Syntrophales bacterium]|nr:hypothetical protein [Syntrophales bacterium]
MNVNRTSYLSWLIKRLKRLALLAPIFFILLSLGVVPATASPLSMGYQITDGYFLPTSNSAIESLTGSFVIRPAGITAFLPDGSIIYPNPPDYSYDSILISTQHRTIGMGTVETVPDLPVVVPDFSYNQGTLSMSPHTLERTILQHGFLNGNEYWLYQEQNLVPVVNDTASSFLTYSASVPYYPGAIHFTYTLNDEIERVTTVTYPPGSLGPLYSWTLESSTDVGTLVFDATPVPESTTIWLLSSGLIGKAGLRKRFSN